MKQIFTLALTFLLIFSLVSVTAFAADATITAENDIATTPVTASYSAGAGGGTVYSVDITWGNMEKSYLYSGNRIRRNLRQFWQQVHNGPRDSGRYTSYECTYGYSRAYPLRHTCQHLNRPYHSRNDYGNNPLSYNEKVYSIYRGSTAGRAQRRKRFRFGISIIRCASADKNQCLRAVYRQRAAESDSYRQKRSRRDDTA